MWIFVNIFLINCFVLGECLHRNHANMPFSTYDVDNDKEFELNCAFDYLGGWWFNECYESFLNGPWSSMYTTHIWCLTFSSMQDVLSVFMLIKSHEEWKCSWCWYLLLILCINLMNCIHLESWNKTFQSTISFLFLIFD